MDGAFCRRRPLPTGVRMRPELAAWPRSRFCNPRRWPCDCPLARQGLQPIPPARQAGGRSRRQWGVRDAGKAAIRRKGRLEIDVKPAASHVHAARCRPPAAARGGPDWAVRSAGDPRRPAPSLARRRRCGVREPIRAAPPPWRGRRGGRVWAPSPRPAAPRRRAPRGPASLRG